MIDSVQRILLHFAALVAVMSLAAAFAAFTFRAGFVRAAFAAPLGLWRGMTPAGRFVSAAFVTVSVIYGGTKTNALPLWMMRQSALPVSPAVTEAESDGDFFGVGNPLPSGLRMFIMYRNPIRKFRLAM